jgi:glycosyltransferase involved in cell wall biosynthesis
LTIVGDGPERDNLEQLVSDLRLRENVRFAGALRGEEIARVLNKHNILLVTSRWKEPFGIVALEGIACGCLPIVSDGGGLPDAIGNAGISFKSGDIDDLVRAIRKVINDPVLTQQMRDAAPSHLVAHSSSQVSQRYLASIESVVHRINKTNLDTACM